MNTSLKKWTLNRDFFHSSNFIMYFFISFMYLTCNLSKSITFISDNFTTIKSYAALESSKIKCSKTNSEKKKKRENPIILITV